ncbi:MAG: Nitrogen fixation protein NifU [Candidatus Roizmanbacteria bacterium GW2011_GWC2_37_13]|uniref:Nitrogen fixation protein NifU n=1 Tax=Candidatus Roizmanbacteria bacterium GW2011_GWC2_37_13 TaxID=1618486 RepID=A0A0G0GK71_9BACT|nr:MAG: Nitrogen fixation protein NifU [Candidatus Roizmanbacteria bacterium GW2011_GWC1_37_12]KKQ26545.1 MAG: Nitrogen fixation protein NifU [Candidatus Roizmanbacteria bacterium GW2011_GWC2_37_13]
MSIYSELILDHYQHPRNFGKIDRPTKTAKVSNPLCGDEVELCVKIAKGKVVEAKFKGKGCAISIASSSMLTQYIKNKSELELKNLDKEFMIKMLGIELGVNRIKCALLPLEALKKL